MRKASLDGPLLRAMTVLFVWDAQKRGRANAPADCLHLGGFTLDGVEDRAVQGAEENFFGRIFPDKVGRFRRALKSYCGENYFRSGFSASSTATGAGTMLRVTRYHLMDDDGDSEVNALLSKARELRRQAQETALPWYRKRMLRLARDVEARAQQLEQPADPPEPKKKGPDNVRPFRQS